MNIALKASDAARTLLRDACGEIHARLDARLSKVNFDDRDEYADMLSRMSAPLTAAESALSAGIAPALFRNWAGKLRGHALRVDCDALGVEFQQRYAAPLLGEAEAFGALYVLEGSRLGGKVLARMAGESANPDVRGATRYFRHGEQAGHWRAFLEALEGSRAVKACPERAIATARMTFASFEAAFT